MSLLLNDLAVLLGHSFFLNFSLHILLIYNCLVLWILWKYFFLNLCLTVNLILSFEFPPGNSTVCCVKNILRRSFFFSLFKQGQASCKGENYFIWFFSSNKFTCIKIKRIRNIDIITWILNKINYFL